MSILQGHAVFVKNVELLYWLKEYTGPNRYRHSEFLPKVSLLGTWPPQFQICRVVERIEIAGKKRVYAVS